MSVEFEDYRVKVKEAIDSAIEAFLYEAGGELQARIQRNSKVDTGQTKGSYQYKVNEAANECQVGSDLENAIWEEFGTGEYALKGNGRKGGWVYKSQKDGKFYRTKGKKPRRPMERAFDSVKSKLIKRISEILADKVGD